MGRVVLDGDRNLVFVNTSLAFRDLRSHKIQKQKSPKTKMLDTPNLKVEEISKGNCGKHPEKTEENHGHLMAQKLREKSVLKQREPLVVSNVAARSAKRYP